MKKDLISKWEKLKTEYVSGTVNSLREVAKKYGMAESTVRKRASAEHWREQKEQIRNNVLQRTLEQMTDKEVEKAVDKLTKVDEVNNTLLNRISDIAVQTEVEELTAKDIKLLAGALKDIMSIILDVNGIKSKQSEDEGAGVIILPEVKGDEE